MRTNCVATVYNRYVVGGVEKYQRTVIGSVLLEHRKAANVIRSGLLAADSVVVYVPFVNGANHLDPIAWQSLISKVGKWTLAVGDYVVKGAVTDEIHDAVVSPPSAAFTMTNLKNKYDDVIQIKSVDTFDMGSISLRHWKVSGS
jgi:hypothetical protein